MRRLEQVVASVGVGVPVHLFDGGDRREAAFDGGLFGRRVVVVKRTTGAIVEAPSVSVDGLDVLAQAHQLRLCAVAPRLDVPPGRIDQRRAEGRHVLEAV